MAVVAGQRRVHPQWHAFIGGRAAVTNDPMEAHYIGFNMWVRAVEKAGSFGREAVQKLDHRLRDPKSDGGEAEMLPSHTSASRC